MPLGHRRLKGQEVDPDHPPLTFNTDTTSASRFNI
jgi:hypothetical protein